MLAFLILLACVALIVQAAQQKPVRRRATVCAEAAPTRPPAPDPDAEAAIIATCDYAAALVHKADLAKAAAANARRETDRLHAELGRAYSDARREHLSAELAAAETLYAKRNAEAMRLYAQAAGLHLRAGNIQRQAEKRAAKR